MIDRRLTRVVVVPVALLVIALALPGAAQDDTRPPAGDDANQPAPPPRAALPEGASGLAAKYPGDRGLENDPAVLVIESFEHGTVADLARRWDDVKNPGGHALQFVERDAPAHADGSRSLRITATLASDTGGHLYRRLPRAVDTLFARFHVKFPADASYTHHFVHLGGYNPATAWPQGGAGERPAGDKRMTLGIEPHGERGKIEPPGTWSFYSYWHRMNVCPDGRFWGNVFQPETLERIPRGQWQCVEVMMKLNTVGKSDGEAALWVDGKLVMHIAPGVRVHVWNTGAKVTLASESDRESRRYDGIDWRGSEELRINFFWLLYYVTANVFRQNGTAAPPATQSVQFDNIALATSYIGPIQPAARRSDDRR